jgi:hypothetical protein
VRGRNGAKEDDRKKTKTTEKVTKTTEKTNKDDRKKATKTKEKSTTCLIGGEGARMPDDHGYHLLPSGAGRQLLPQKQLERGM